MIVIFAAVRIDRVEVALVAVKSADIHNPYRRDPQKGPVVLDTTVDPRTQTLNPRP